jgi:hypothetical protein
MSLSTEHHQLQVRAAAWCHSASSKVLLLLRRLCAAHPITQVVLPRRKGHNSHGVMDSRSWLFCSSTLLMTASTVWELHSWLSQNGTALPFELKLQKFDQSPPRLQLIQSRLVWL